MPVFTKMTNREAVIFDRTDGEVKHLVTGAAMRPKFLGGEEPEIKNQTRREVLAVELAGRVGLKRPSLYKILSKHGNPTLETLQEILKPLGLRVSVALDEAA